MYNVTPTELLATQLGHHVMPETGLDNAIVRRLNALIMVALDSAGTSAGTTTRSKVDRLLAIGLEPAEVASIIGKPVNYITAITAKARKASRTKEKA